MLALLFVQKFVEKQRAIWILLAGAATALAFWSKQNVGIYTLAGLGLSFLFLSVAQKSSLRRFFIHSCWIVAGGLAATAPIAGWILLNNAVLDWYKQTFLHSVVWARMLGGAYGFYPSMFPRSESLVSLWAIIPIAVISVLFRAVLAKKPPLTLIVAGIFGLTSWFQYFPMSDPLHTYWAATPMIGIFVYFFYHFICVYDGAKRAGKAVAFLFSTLLIILAVYPDVKHRLRLAQGRLQTEYVTLQTPLVLQNMKTSANEAEWYWALEESIAQYEKRYGETRILNITAHAMLPTLGQAASFHPLSVEWPTTNTVYPEYQEVKLRYLQEQRPLVTTCANLNDLAAWPVAYCPISPEFENTCIRIFADCERPL